MDLPTPPTPPSTQVSIQPRDERVVLHRHERFYHQDQMLKDPVVLQVRANFFRCSCKIPKFRRWKTPCIDFPYLLLPKGVTFSRQPFQSTMVTLLRGSRMNTQSFCHHQFRVQNLMFIYGLEFSELIGLLLSPSIPDVCDGP